MVATVIEHVAPVKPARITSHSRLSDILVSFEAPPVKEIRMKPVNVNSLETRARTMYYMHQIKAAADSAKNPNTNLTLHEILTGERLIDKIGFLIGVFFVLASKK
jgi:hypothetical protein